MKRVTLTGTESTIHGGRLRFTVFCAMLASGLAAVPLRAVERETVPGTIAIFPLQGASLQMNALRGQISRDRRGHLEQPGQVPAPARGNRAESHGRHAGRVRRGGAPECCGRMNADLYAVITIPPMGSSIVGTVTFKAVSPRYKLHEAEHHGQEPCPDEHSLKLAREIALLHRDMPVEADILEKRDGRTS